VGIELNKDLQNSFKSGVEPTLDQLQYCVLDVLVLETIHQIQREILIEENLIRTASLEFAIIPTIAQIELNGMTLDQMKLERLKAGLVSQFAEVESAMNEQVRKLNFECGKPQELPCYNSPLQMIKILNELGYEVKSSAAGVLSRLDHPFANNLMKYRKLSKLLNSFANSLPQFINPETGRVHQSIFQLGIVTGRTSSSSPNLQQMPKQQEWRDLFIARPGYKLITADYSQIELRILAEYSQDTKLLFAFRQGIDFHALTAAEIFWTPIKEVTKWQQDAAKAVNFGIVYGMSPYSLAEQLGVGIRKAKGFIDR
jgi:DNA polymerase I-like protein with 3'-5' exonuclease and polymerase domains